MDVTKVKEALSKLDAGNDNHWTQDGKPKVDTVKMYSKGEAVTRELLDEHFPDFNRDNTELEPKTAEDQASGEVVEDATGEAQPQASSGDTSEKTEEEQNAEAEALADEQADADSVENADVNNVGGPEVKSVGDASDSSGELESSLPLLQSILGYARDAVNERGQLTDPNDRVKRLQAVVNELHSIRRESLIVIQQLEVLVDKDIMAAEAVQPKSHAQTVQDYLTAQKNLTKLVDVTETRARYPVDEPRARPAQKR